MYIEQEIKVGTYVENMVQEIYTGGIVADNASGAFVTECVFSGMISAKATLPDAMKDALAQVYKEHSGFVAGSNNGYIGKCTNASTGDSLNAQGMGNGTVE